MHGVPRSQLVGKYIERVTAHAKTSIGRLEWRIATEIGEDLWEVREWSLEKKFDYQQNMAVEALVQQQARDGDFDMDGAEMPDMSNLPSAGSAPNVRGQGQSGGTTESTQHPGLKGYDTLVNVKNDGDDDE